MRLRAAPVLAIVTISLLSTPFLARTDTAGSVPLRTQGEQGTPINKKSTTPPPLINKKHPLTPQSAEGGIWRTDHSFQPIFMLRNILEVMPMTVTPVLYMADGTEYDLTPVVLDPAGVAMVNIRDALQNAPPDVQAHISMYGSAAIHFDWVWAGGVFGAVRDTDDLRGLIYQTHLQADAMKTHDPKQPQGSQVLQGVWWKQDAQMQGFLTLVNTSLNPVVTTFRSPTRAE